MPSYRIGSARRALLRICELARAEHFRRVGGGLVPSGLVDALLADAEERMANRLSDLAQHWNMVMCEAAADSAVLIASRTNDMSGERAKQFVAKLESLGAEDEQRRASFSKAARDETAAVLREWVEPKLEFCGRWFATGVVACLSSALLGALG